MYRRLTIILLFCVAALPLLAQPAPNPADTETLLKAMRGDMQSSKAAILGKNMMLSAEHASKFWPLYDKYQKEQGLIIDEQLKDAKAFVEKFDTLDDATAVSLLNAYFERDTKLNDLRKKWLGEFAKAIGGKQAVRAMQIDRRLSLIVQLDIMSQIPLAHD